MKKNKRKMKKLNRNQLEAIIVSQNSKIKNLIDQTNALRSQNKSLKLLLQRPRFDSSWIHGDLIRVERAMESLRTTVDHRREAHKKVENEIKVIENGPTNEENQNG